MHFASRFHAGKILAKQLYPIYRYEDCVVIALNPGGVVVASQIAQSLHAALLMILAKELEIAHEPISIGSISSTGDFILNDSLSNIDSSELMDEYRGLIEEQKIVKMSEMSKITGTTELINKKMIQYRTVILVSDGLRGDLFLNLAYEFLKPIKINKIIVATPIADVKAVDWMHIMVDKIFCLWVTDDLDVNRYYDQNTIPDEKTITKIIQNIILNWQ